ncbi:MAG TPA: recombinase family protein [Gemmataceae bacterium]|jgi:DNA invertase Pin-like site-specific DNA recombinase
MLDFTPLDETDAIAFSYIRFSTPDQMKGNSLERQIAAALDWCKRKKVRLDTSLTLHDLGKSAFLGEHRKNPDRHALAAFLKLVEQGKVPRGSYLIIESLDRLTREHVRAGLMLLLSLIEAGIRIVQLSPTELVYDEHSDEMSLMLAIVELARGHRESKRKSDLNGAAWNAKLTAARSKIKQPPRRKDGRIVEGITDRLPAWIAVEGDRLVLIPERADAVRRIFVLAANGYGVQAIVKKLTAEGIPPFGNREMVLRADGTTETILTRGKGRPRYKGVGGYGSGAWNRAYIAKILKDRRAVGEYQPCGKGRKPQGDPIPGYFPACVTEEQFHAARAGAQDRQRRRGRIGRHVNVFAGLLRHAKDGDTFFFGTAGGRRAMINTRGADGSAPYVSFPADIFETAMRRFLKDIDPKEILDGVNGHGELMALQGELGEVEAAIVALVADLDQHGESPTLYARLRAKEARRAELLKLLAEAQQKAANPLSDAWGQLQAVLGRDGNEEERMRLRGILRRTVEEIQVLIVRRGVDRLAWVQVWFAGGDRRRDFLIYYRPARGNVTKKTPACVKVESKMLTAPIDLRTPADARKLESYLAAEDVETLAANMTDLESGQD